MNSQSLEGIEWIYLSKKVFFPTYVALMACNLGNNVEKVNLNFCSIYGY